MPAAAIPPGEAARRSGPSRMACHRLRRRRRARKRPARSSNWDKTASCGILVSHAGAVTGGLESAAETKEIAAPGNARKPGTAFIKHDIKPAIVSGASPLIGAQRLTKSCQDVKLLIVAA